MTKAHDALKLPTPPKELGRAVRSYGAECWVAGAAVARQEQVGLLHLLAEIRAAIGDPHGQLMQDELLTRIRELARPLNPDMNMAAAETARHLAPRPRKLWGTAADVDGNAAIYTEADLLGYGEVVYCAGRFAGRLDDREELRRAENQRRHEEERAWGDWRSGNGPKPGGPR